MHIMTLIVPILIICIEIKSHNRDEKLAHYTSSILFFELIANVGYIFRVGNFEIQYSDILWIAMICHCLFELRNRMEQKSFCVILLFSGVIVINIINSLFVNEIENNIIRSCFVFVKILFMFVAIYTLKKNKTFHKTNLFMRQICSFQVLTYVIVGVEFVIKNVLKSSAYNQIIATVFGVSENQVTWLVERGGMYSLQGLCKEPSHFAIMLFFLSVYDCLFLKKEKKWIRLIFLNVILIVISGSLSCLLYLGCLAGFYVVLSEGYSKKILAVSMGMVGAFFVMLLSTYVPVLAYYVSRVTNLFAIFGGEAEFYVQNYTSEGMRMNSVFESLEFFLKEPFWGVGLGNNVNTGGFSAMLGAIGGIGMLSYLLCINKLVGVSLKELLFILLASFFAMDMGVFYSSYFMCLCLLVYKYKENLKFGRIVEKREKKSFCI